MIESTEKINLVLKKDWDYPPHPEKEQGHFIGRKDELRRLIDNYIRRDSGSILVSGDRGVGKTSLVYKALQEVKKKNDKTIFIVLNALQLGIETYAKTDKTIKPELKEKIIKNLIRRFYAAASSGNKIRENKIKSELKTLYKKAVASEVEFKEKTKKVDIDTEEEFLTIVGEIKLSISALKAIIASACVGLAVFFQFNPVTSYEALNKSLPILALFPLPIFFLYSYKYKKTKGVQKEKSKSAEEYYKFDANIGNLEYDFEQVLSKLNNKGYNSSLA